MKEPQIVLKVKHEGMAEGEVKAHRKDVLAVLQMRLANPVPESVRLAVEGTNDPDTLRRWHLLAVGAKTIQEFAGLIATAQ